LVINGGRQYGETAGVSHQKNLDVGGVVDDTVRHVDHGREVVPGVRDGD
jgi:hypothetical protein